MQRLPELTLLERTIRSRICPQCFNRPKGSESLKPDQPRTCEPVCTIFIHLPKVRQVVLKVHDPSVGPYEKALVEEVCEGACTSSPTSGDFCSERTTRRCPLATYVTDVVSLIESVHQSQSRIDTRIFDPQV